MDSFVSERAGSAQDRFDHLDNKLVQQLVLQNPVGMALFEGPRHTCRFINPRFESLLNIPQHHLIGKTAKEIFRELHDQRLFEYFEKVYRTGEPGSISAFPLSIARGEFVHTTYYDFQFQPVQQDGWATNGIILHVTELTQSSPSNTLGAESEISYRRIFETMDEAFALIEMSFDDTGKAVDYVFLEVNNVFEMQSGLKNAAGKSIRELMPGVEEQWLDIFGEVARTGKSVRFTHRSKIMGRWFELNAFRLGNAGSKKIAFLFHDITAKRLAEQSVEEHEELLQAIFDASPNSMAVLEPIENEKGEVEDFVFVMLNALAVQTTGRTDLVGKRYGHEFPKAIEHGLVEKFKEVAASGQPTEFEKWHDREGRRQWLHFSATRVGKLLVVSSEDITARKEEEEELRKSETYFRQLTDTVPAIIWITRPDGYCTYLNKHWYDYTDQTEGEAEGFGWLKATHPDDAEEAGRQFMEASQKHQAFHVFYRLRHKSGEYRWVIDNGQPRFAEDGSFEGMIGTVIEVHEQKIAEDKIRESEHRFRSMADASPVMIWTLDENGNSTYYNRQAREFTGHTAKDIEEGKSWQVAIHPEDIDYASSVVRNAVSKRIPYEMECRMQNAKGEWRWLLNHGTPRFGVSGEYFGFVGSSIDITEQKNSQQQLQTALEQTRLSKEAAELGTFDLDFEKGTLHWDERCRTLFGISHNDEVSYEKDFVGGLHPDDRDRILAVIQQLLENRIPRGEYDVEYRTVGASDGVVRWVRAKGKMYYNEQAKPTRFIGSILDITEKVNALQRIESLVEERTKELAEANGALHQINKELERSNQNLEEFAHAASHDLKEPVRKIHFFTHQLKQQLNAHLKEDDVYAFSRIEKATERMRNLIDDLLLYSHVSQRPHDTETIDLNQKVRNVLEDLELDIAEKKAIVRFDSLPTVNGYRRQLQQLFQNLISNALKYSRKDIPPQIDITATKAQVNGRDYHVIAVKDNGIGFEAVYSDKIFQMFARLHGRNEYSGTGVGLSIVKKVVENHNGFITADSIVGVGSEFKVYLPV